MAAWSSHELGASFVLVNPLHAPAPVTPLEHSPYLPVTRRFVSPLYLHVENIEEFAQLDPVLVAEVQRLARALRDGNTSDLLLDRDAVWEAKKAALTLVHKVPRNPVRQDSFAQFREEQGSGLVDFATWCALVEVHGSHTRDWPEELRDPRSAATRSARGTPELAQRIDFYCWLQWVADQQLAAAQQAARAAGMPLGVVHDLAVGVHPDGADTWALGEALARGVTVGAPPDAFNQQGQDWSQPPWRPDRLRDTAYAPFRDMIRTILRHAGGIRIDHILGFFRLWWVPAGAPPSEGTYVRYDHEAMIGILALEAYRAGALVVGEDLGTVEPWVRDYLAERGIFGTSVLWFERDENGRPLPPERWRELCLATVTTHDLPPTAGYLTGEHVRIRSELGLLTRPVEEEAEADSRERSEWLDLLRSKGLLAENPSEQDVVEALHRLLTLAPSRLLGVALPDAVGDRRAMNQPGTADEYPNWRFPLADATGRPVPLEELFSSPRAAALAATLDAPNSD
jgi:4-alpha-glucanotransferase